jgi:rRNA maturation protein Nop10
MNFKDAALDIESLENKFKKYREDLSRGTIENVQIRYAELRIEVEADKYEECRRENSHKIRVFQQRKMLCVK